MNVLVYVHDLIICGTDSAFLSSFKQYLGGGFRMKELGPLKYFSGIEVAPSVDGFFLSQRKYTLDILSEVGQLGGKHVDTRLSIIIIWLVLLGLCILIVLNIDVFWDVSFTWLLHTPIWLM